MSIKNITFLDQIIPHSMFVFNNSPKTRFYFNDYLEVKQFLNSLDPDQVYVITFDFISSLMMYSEDTPVIALSKPILITKNSNHIVISHFLKERINAACNSHFLDESILEMLTIQDGPGVLVNYSKINNNLSSYINIYIYIIELENGTILNIKSNLLISNAKLNNSQLLTFASY